MAEDTTGTPAELTDLVRAYEQAKKVKAEAVTALQAARKQAHDAEGGRYLAKRRLHDALRHVPDGVIVDGRLYRRGRDFRDLFEGDPAEAEGPTESPDADTNTPEFQEAVRWIAERGYQLVQRIPGEAANRWVVEFVSRPGVTVWSTDRIMGKGATWREAYETARAEFANPNRWP